MDILSIFGMILLFSLSMILLVEVFYGAPWLLLDAYTGSYDGFTWTRLKMALAFIPGVMWVMFVVHMLGLLITKFKSLP